MKENMHPKLSAFIQSNYLTILIDFENSVINEKAKFQFIVLKKPNDIIAKELDDLPYVSDAEKILLIFECLTARIVFCPLSFAFQLPGRTGLDNFNFETDLVLKQVGEQIMIIQHSFLDSSRCIDVVIISLKGDLISAWKIDGGYDDEIMIDDFTQVRHDHWLVKFKIKGLKEGITGSKLHLLTNYSVKGHGLSLNTKASPSAWSLQESKMKEIKAWFSEEEGRPKFFVLASKFHCCIYSASSKAEKEEPYIKIADLAVETSIEDFKVLQEPLSTTISFINSTRKIGHIFFSFTFRK